MQQCYCSAVYQSSGAASVHNMTGDLKVGISPALCLSAGFFLFLALDINKHYCTNSLSFSLIHCDHRAAVKSFV